MQEPQSNLEVAIITELKITSGDGILVQNPTTLFKLKLTGIVDYCIVRYRADNQVKGRCPDISCALRFTDLTSIFSRHPLRTRLYSRRRRHVFR